MAASSRVKYGKSLTGNIKTCYRCSKVLRKDKEIIVDDDPFGLLCLKCEDTIYGQWMDIGDEYPLVEH